jgi:hypothetical protein
VISSTHNLGLSLTSTVAGATGPATAHGPTDPSSRAPRPPDRASTVRIGPAPGATLRSSGTDRWATRSGWRSVSVRETCGLSWRACRALRAAVRVSPQAPPATLRRFQVGGHGCPCRHCALQWPRARSGRRSAQAAAAAACFVRAHAAPSASTTASCGCGVWPRRGAPLAASFRREPELALDRGGRLRKRKRCGLAGWVPAVIFAEFCASGLTVG